MDQASRRTNSATQRVLEADEQCNTLFALGWCTEELDLILSTTHVELAWDTECLDIGEGPVENVSFATGDLLM